MKCNFYLGKLSKITADRQTKDILVTFTYTSVASSYTFWCIAVFLFTYNDIITVVTPDEATARTSAMSHGVTARYCY